MVFLHIEIASIYLFSKIILMKLLATEASTMSNSLTLPFNSVPSSYIKATREHVTATKK